MDRTNWFFHGARAMLRRLAIFEEEMRQSGEYRLTWDREWRDYRYKGSHPRPQNRFMYWMRTVDGEPCGGKGIYYFDPDKLMAEAQQPYVSVVHDETMLRHVMGVKDGNVDSIAYGTVTYLLMLEEGVRVREYEPQAWSEVLYYEQILSYPDALLLVPHFFSADPEAITLMAQELRPGAHDIDLTSLAPDDPEWWRDLDVLEERCHELGARRKEWLVRNG